MGRKVDVEDLIDSKEAAVILDLSHAETVHQYLRRYPDFPRPAVDRPGLKLWVRPEVRDWARRHRQGWHPLPTSTP